MKSSEIHKNRKKSIASCEIYKNHDKPTKKQRNLTKSITIPRNSRKSTKIRRNHQKTKEIHKNLTLSNPAINGINAIIVSSSLQDSWFRYFLVKFSKGDALGPLSAASKGKPRQAGASRDNIFWLPKS